MGNFVLYWKVIRRIYRVSCTQIENKSYLIDFTKEKYFGNYKNKFLRCSGNFGKLPKFNASGKMTHRSLIDQLLL